MKEQHLEFTTINIGNNGQEITETNYWQTSFARDGLFFLSWNAGAARLLIPKSVEDCISEMNGASYVVVSSGTWKGSDAVEILFEDDSDMPFSIHIKQEFVDRIIPPSSNGNSFVFTVWTESGKKKTFEGKYRVVQELPCLQPWS